MYAITGITGKVGGELGRRLLAAGQSVRAVVRDPAKGAVWAGRGCEIAHAEMEEATQLAAAFAGAEAVFVLPPSEFDPEPGYPEARGVIDALVSGLAAARPERVLCLSTIGADASHDNLLTQRTLLEQDKVDELIGLQQLTPGAVNGRVGISLGTDACNKGTIDVEWFALSDNRHPFIPQNVYRMSGGADNTQRFEQIGQSWGKHAFTAASSNTCGFGCNGVGGNHLGSGCSDSYGAGFERQPNRHRFARLGESVHRRLHVGGKKSLGP